MIVFIAIAVLLTLLALAWMVRPLLRPAAPAGVSSQRLNASIYRDQLEALERDLARGAISAEDCEATRDELQLRLLDDTEEASPPVSQPATASFWTGRRTAAAIALLLPLGAAGMYWWLGAPEAINPVAAKQANDDKIVAMVNSLAARLKDNPDNPKGWAMLARSYKVIGRLQEAEEAYAKAGKLVESDPDLLADYADLLAARAGNNLEGKPRDLINKALALNPLHPMSLMLAGTAAYREGNFAGAVQHWEKLLSQLETGSPDAEQLQSYIDDARAKGGMKVSPAASAGKPPVPTGPAGAAQQPSNEQIVQMVDGLAARLKANPGDLDGWARLARAYKALGRLPEADEAYAKAGALVDGNPDMLTDYADLLAIRAGNNLEGRPLALVNKALALDPRHPMALMLAGSAAYRRGDYPAAIAQWEKLLPLFQPGSRDAEWVTSNIADARVKGGLAAPASVRK